jgi:tRNA A37 threonylcarbamoyladenosine biosynthesis protein TsaE
LEKIGFDDCLADDAVVAIEWADKFREAIPSSARWLHFEIREDGSRVITEN